jgi:hypothetical protein
MRCMPRLLCLTLLRLRPQTLVHHDVESHQVRHIPRYAMLPLPRLPGAAFQVLEPSPSLHRSSTMTQDADQERNDTV